jgi:hypothetical protein
MVLMVFTLMSIPHITVQFQTSQAPSHKIMVYYQQ